ncbi:PTS sugar transporter subunit IIA [Abyssisolibacter fermentans]|uniref:PTS sugar transporter subunit IIA n=1 Tax=Abyssisolibacter fermentans TaxID=1766203 RepID=UPI00083354A5|nr:PTS sugar transporter subunit IIA [Abyssisolibacter fermentans]
MFFSEEIVFFNQSFNNKEDALKKLAGEFLKKGLVKDTFFQAVIDREKGYPTGLNINGIGVAIPHTDGIHINKPQIGFMSLKEPVIFKDMVDDQHEIEVNTIFMLGLLKSEQQVEMLQKLVGLFQDETSLKKVIACKNIDEFKDIMKKANIN